MSQYVSSTEGHSACSTKLNPSTATGSFLVLRKLLSLSQGMSSWFQSRDPAPALWPRKEMYNFYQASIAEEKEYLVHPRRQLQLPLTPIPESNLPEPWKECSCIAILSPRVETGCRAPSLLTVLRVYYLVCITVRLVVRLNTALQQINGKIANLQS